MPPALREGTVGGQVAEPRGEHRPRADPVGEPGRGREVVRPGRPVPPGRPDGRQAESGPGQAAGGLRRDQHDLEAGQRRSRRGDRVGTPGARLPERLRRIGQVGDAPGALGDDRGDQVAGHLRRPRPRRRVHAEHPVAAGQARQRLVDRELLAPDQCLIRGAAPQRDAVRRAPVPHHKRLAPHIDSLNVHPARLVPLAPPAKTTLCYSIVLES